MPKIILYLLIIAGLGGGIFYMHHLKKSAEAMEQEKIQAEKLARKEREIREAKEREAREVREREAEEARIREAREREVREAKEREERKERETREAKEREAKEAEERKIREAKEQEERAANQVLTDLDLRIGDLKSELEEFRAIRKDPAWHCFDLCINFGSISFNRTMHSEYVDVGPGIYYIENGIYCSRFVKFKKCGYIYFDVLKDQSAIPIGRPRSRRVGRRTYWEKVPVTYFCKRHRILWSSSMVRNYKQHYIPVRDIERREKEIDRELKVLESKKNDLLKKPGTPPPAL